MRPYSDILKLRLESEFCRRILGDQLEGSAEGPASKRLRITHKTAYQLMRQQTAHATGGAGNDEV